MEALGNKYIPIFWNLLVEYAFYLDNKPSFSKEYAWNSLSVFLYLSLPLSPSLTFSNVHIKARQKHSKVKDRMA